MDVAFSVTPFEAEVVAEMMRVAGLTTVPDMARTALYWYAARHQELDIPSDTFQLEAVRMRPFEPPPVDDNQPSLFDDEAR